MGQLGITIGTERTTSSKQKLGHEMYLAIFFILYVTYVVSNIHARNQV